jgi:DNA-directed RNA polymerase subunit RPC12/RpoP
MSVTEKIAYLKGLAEGLGVDGKSKEGKLLAAVIDVLDGLTREVSELGENALDLGEEIDVLSTDLSEIEELLFDDEDEDDDEDDDACDCDCCRAEDDDDEDFDYAVACPSCGEDIVLKEADLAAGGIVCPKCGEKLEYDFQEVDDGDDE